MKNCLHTNNTNNIVDKPSHDYKCKAKPFLKWVGGKRQLLNTFQTLYPPELKHKTIKNYYEPFLGGGAVFFDVAQNYEIKNAYLYDINDDLILTYQVIKRNVCKFIERLYKTDVAYKTLNEQKRKKYYYELRDNFNKQRSDIDYDKYSENWIPRAAQIIFLNKTCFNGLFRFNAKGDYNAPMGKYKNPRILDTQNLINVSKLLERATIRKADFREVKKNMKNSSFVYFDPPYRPISKTANFTSYNKSDFHDNEQIELAELFRYLDQQGHLLMLSNSDPKNINVEDDFFETMYADYNITKVKAKRSINSNAKKRKAIKEIVVTNY